ncbi:hypothetical protein BH11MYX3_BH11MYX3_12860 [soil metagenome]
MPEDTGAFDAIVVADSPHRHTKLLGLTLVERGRRVATRVGARRVFVIEDAADAAALPAWAAERGDAGLLVIRAGDQMTHVPLVKPLVEGSGPRRIAVGPDDAYAGALYVTGDARDVISTLAANPAAGDQALASAWTDAQRIPHGAIARHSATTPKELKAAKKLLLKILAKPAEDSPISTYIYRPLSKPLTQLLLPTRITPNQVSYFVGVLGLFGCYLVAQPSQTALIWGAFLVFASCVIDGVDGELSRLRLTSSWFGAWLDTVIDEITSVTFFFAIGYHTYVHHPHSWIAASIAIGAVFYVFTIYAIYYFCIVVLKSGGSQYYQGDLEIVDGPDGALLRPRAKPPSTLPPWLQKLGTVGLWMIRRDFINVAAWCLTFANAFEVIYGGIGAGVIIAGLIIIPEHFKLRRQLRELARRGAQPRYVSA